MPLFKECCCCLSLHTGGVILGVLGAIRSFIGIALSSLALIYVDDLVIEGLKARQQTLESGNEVQFSNHTILTNEEIDDATEITRLVVKIILCIFLVVCVVDFCCAVLLIIGSKRHRKELILPYLVTDGLGIIISTLFFVFMAFNGPNLAGNLVSAIIGFLISGYLWLCVFSLYQLMKEQSRAPAVIRTAYPEQQAVYSTMT